MCGKKRAKQIAFYIAVDSSIAPLLRRYYVATPAISEKVLTEEVVDQSVINVLNDYISNALRQRASDIHFEPQEKKIRLRMRIDGILHDVADFDPKIYQRIISRVKLLSKLKLNITLRIKTSLPKEKSSL